MLLPRRDQAENVIVAGTPSTSHVVFCSIRMEPQFMQLGHAAGVLAALAQQQPSNQRQRAGGARAVQDVPAAQLHAVLKMQGQVLELPTAPAARAPPFMCLMNRCVAVTAAAFHPGAALCQFCAALADNEWLASINAFTPHSVTSTNITALHPTVLQKSLVPAARESVPKDHMPSNSTKHVPAGYSCARVYLQHYRGVWICAT